MAITSKEDIFKQLAPRRYSTPPGYISPTKVLMDLATVISVVDLDDRPSKEENNNAKDARWRMFVGASLLAAYKTPVYFLSKELLESLQATSLPDDMASCDINWALPAMIVMLPVGGLKIGDSYYQYLIVARTESATTKPIKLLNGRSVRISSDQSIAFSLILSQDSATYSISLVNCDSGSKMSDLDAHQPTAFRTDDKSIDQADVKNLHNVTMALALKILLLMQARPELVDSISTLERPAKIKRGVEVKSELWSPRWIGKTYTRQHETNQEHLGTHASPQEHIRKGHWRNQVCGQGRLARKLIWIDPCWVNLAS